MPGIVARVSYHMPLIKLHSNKKVNIWGLIGPVESYVRPEKGEMSPQKSVTQPIDSSEAQALSQNG